MPTSGTTGITLGLDTWKMQDNYVERYMDNAAYSAAHPDDTLVLAGPPRRPVASNATSSTTSGTYASSMLAIGHLQACSFSQQKPTQPVMAIGSGRTFFVSGKAQGQATLSRLFINGRNLMRVLHHNARANGLDVSLMDDKPAYSSTTMYYLNLDSELYLVPIGLAVLFQDKIHETLGGFYAELVMITSYAVGFNAGQNMILEQTSLVFDRLTPFFEGWSGGANSNMPAAVLSKVMAFADNTKANAQSSGDYGSPLPAA